VKTAKNENGDEIYESLKAVVNQGHDKNRKHTVEVHLCVKHNESRSQLYNQVYVDSQAVETSRMYDSVDPQRAYMQARIAWRRTLDNLMDKEWPVPAP
jgi:hypothetical protein